MNLDRSKNSLLVSQETLDINSHVTIVHFYEFLKFFYRPLKHSNYYDPPPPLQ